jgi:hypothetical protein
MFLPGHEGRKIYPSGKNIRQILLGSSSRNIQIAGIVSAIQTYPLHRRQACCLLWISKHILLGLLVEHSDCWLTGPRLSRTHCTAWIVHVAYRRSSLLRHTHGSRLDRCEMRTALASHYFAARFPWSNAPVRRACPAERASELTQCACQTPPDESPARRLRSTRDGPVVRGRSEPHPTILIYG